MLWILVLDEIILLIIIWARDKLENIIVNILGCIGPAVKLLEQQADGFIGISIPTTGYYYYYMLWINVIQVA